MIFHDIEYFFEVYLNVDLKLKGIQMNEKSIVKGTAKQHSSSPSTIAQCIKSVSTWDKSELPHDTANKLRNICNTINSSFGASSLTFVLGKAQIVFFNGLAETHKTEVMELIANELHLNIHHLDIHHIDLSAIASKYIGETEKYLHRLFNNLQDTNTILYLDEADSLFANNSQAKAAHVHDLNIDAHCCYGESGYHGIVVLAICSPLTLVGGI